MATRRQSVPRVPSASRKEKPRYLPSTPLRAIDFEMRISTERQIVANKLNIKTMQIYLAVVLSPVSSFSAGNITIRVAPAITTNMPTICEIAKRSSKMK